MNHSDCMLAKFQYKKVISNSNVKLCFLKHDVVFREKFKEA